MLYPYILYRYTSTYTQRHIRQRSSHIQTRCIGSNWWTGEREKWLPACAPSKRWRSIVYPPPHLLFHTSPANIKFAHANPDRCSTTRLFCVSSFNFFYLSFFSLPRAFAVPECHILPCQTITQYDGYRTRSKSLFHPYHLRQTR